MGRPKQFNREGVLDRAIPVFWKHGFANTTVQHLEEATGVNKSGLYMEFKDKEDLFLASLERYAQTRGAEILTAQPLGWGNIERFLRLGFGCDDNQRGCFAVNSMRELAGLPAQAQEIISSSQQKLTRLLIKNIEAEKPNFDASMIADVVLTFYFEVRSADAQKQLLNDTVDAYSKALALTEYRFEGGAAPKSDVAQAQTQLDAARVLATDITVQRAQYEHALAILIGKPPAAFSLPPTPLNIQPPELPSVPVVLPAQLLERRPDIAAAERRMAAANEQIGIARAAYFPTLNLAALAGLEGSSLLNWFNWPSRFWAVGASMSETLFDGGRRRSTTESARAGYDASMANYRQTVLTSFQQVEDNLVVLRELSTESVQQHEATTSAEESLRLFQNRYAGGVDTYLQVVTSQTTALANQRNDIDILRRRLEANVLLIKAIGGGWDVSTLPKL